MGFLSKVQAIEFKRLLSNLINNAVEALSTRGQVAIHLYGKEDQVILEIGDNGKGIPEEIMSKIMVRGASFGKQGGSGLGLYHAKSRIENWGGKLLLQSSVNVGTTVQLILPRAPSPSWFVPMIRLSENSTIVVIDDDKSIHEVWGGRFQSLKLFEHHIQVIHLSNPDEAKKWKQNENNITSRQVLYLCDYEFIGSKQNGLDLIEQLDIGSSSILITSHYEEPEIRERCKHLKVKLIPKELAGFIPIEILPITAPDAILIDDDTLAHSIWQMSAKQRGKTIKTFLSPEQFMFNANGLKSTIPVFIDSQLASDVKGEDAAKEIFEIMGFKEIYLVTGFDKEKFPAMYWIREILGKNPPW
jgi:anti-sigma regulatory factor (Ser/Thr protein kinase)